MKKEEMLTVGQVAKEMDVTVRTLQYYDKEGVLKPSARSEGGRRLYTKKDIVKLHQILSLKYLGFSLEDIKEKLFSLDDPKEVAMILENQCIAIREQIEKLNVALSATETLRKEVIQSGQVDYSKFAYIISLLKQNNENYWVVNAFSEKLLDHVRDRFKDDPNSGKKIFDKYIEIVDRSIELKKNNELPTSNKSIELAKEWWNMIIEFTGGDFTILPELSKFNDNKDNWDNSMAEKQKYLDDFIEESLTAYFESENLVFPNMEA